MMITISSLKEGDDNHKDDIHDKMFRNLVPLPEYSLVKKVGRMAGYQLRSFHYQDDDDDNDDDDVGDD